MAMVYPLTIEVNAPEDTPRDLILEAIAASLPEYRNCWGDHASFSYAIAQRAIVPYVADPEDNPETPIAHVWITVIPHD